VKQGCCLDNDCTSKTCMNLPDGQTCGDCKHVDRCVALVGAKRTNTVCDWFPRKFTPRASGGGS